ncbi:hypothetical protein ULMS_10330 [Patiriisocius marinistellae]|uniref:MAM domain-containing protein n=1 Tax=Patiriisocius marinistellae TaxID=2494560 RepID=A0A5J4FZQ2_9FLAO|nr:DUF1028 domain-containing protein [Patiriisocius marinistellae]GEQ85525.1 hypothetical protein ULMS_10330 [Patiriisocius marinistellae]
MKTLITSIIALLTIATIFLFKSNSDDSYNIQNQELLKNNPESQVIDTSRNDEGDTFSIVAFDPNTGQVGGAGCSCVNFDAGIDFLSDLIRDNDGNIIGGIHSQAAYNESTQIFARNRMLAGDSPQQIITATVNADGQSASRQYGIVGFDNAGNLTHAGFTGSSNGHYGNNIGGSDTNGITYSIQGNILDNDSAADNLNGQDLLNDMETAFVNTDGNLAEKLMAAMQAAKRVGGDSRCESDTNSGRTAFIQVLSPGESTPSLYYNTDAISGQATTNGVPNFTEPIDKLQDMFDDGENVSFCNELVTEFPYAMDFETNSWKRFDLDGNPNDNDRSWMRDRGTTASGNTGPTNANQGTFYTYLEASDITGASDNAAIASPCFEIPSDFGAQISFDYHMLGGNIGTLALQANNQTGSGWVTLWSKTGAQGSNWFNDQTVNLNAYRGNNVKLRFIGSRNGSFASDMAIDDINVTLIPCPDIASYNNGWTDGDISSISSNTTISTDYNTSLNGGSFDACTLTVTNNATLTITAGDYVNVNGNITVNAGASLIIEHTGSVVQIMGNATVTNNGTINVALTTPELTARDFMFLGSPMTTSSDAVFNNPYQLLKHTTQNFSPFPGISGINFLNNNNNAFDYSNHTGVLNPGEGYLLRPSYTDDGSYNYNFTEGTLNSGDISYNAFFGDNKEDSPSIISNPYASAIDAEKFIEDNSRVSEVYFWEHNITPNSGVPGPLTENFSMEDISTYNGMMGIPAASGGTTPNGIISTGQGFGIMANSGGDITFTNAMRLTSGNTTLRAQLEDKDLMRLNVLDNKYNLGSTAGLGFIATATNEIDPAYDTQRLGTVVSLYSHLQDGTEQLGIQGLGSFNDTMSVPFGFSTLIENRDDQSYTISLSSIEGINIEGETVLLTDNELGITTNLSINEYTFQADAGTYDNRFTVHFQQETLGLTNTNAENIKLYPNPTNGIITISSQNAIINKIKIFDPRGREIVNIKKVSNNTYKINLATLDTAVYYAIIETDKGTITKKIIKN